MRLLAIAGEPGTGKTTTLREVLRALGASPGDPETAGLVMYHEFPQQKLVVLGDYSSRRGFPGSDKLSMAVPPQVPDFLEAMRSHWSGYTVVWEGDRLTGRKLLDDLSGRFPFRLYILRTSDDELGRRRFLRGDRQGAKFVSGRKTKTEKLRALATAELTSETDEDRQRNVKTISDGIRQGW